MDYIKLKTVRVVVFVIGISHIFSILCQHSTDLSRNGVTNSESHY